MELVASFELFLGFHLTAEHDVAEFEIIDIFIDGPGTKDSEKVSEVHPENTVFTILELELMLEFVVPEW